MFDAKTFPSWDAVAYSEIRPALRTGDTLMYHSPHSKGSKAIQWGTGSCYNHIAGVIVVPPPVDLVMLVEATHPDGVIMAPLSKRLTAARSGIVVARHRKFHPSHTGSYMRTALEYQDSEYDLDQIRAIGRSVIRKQLGWQTLEYQTDDALICSEYQWLCYRACGLVIPPNSGLNCVVPADFALAPEMELIAVLQRPDPD